MRHVLLVADRAPRRQRVAHQVPDDDPPVRGLAGDDRLAAGVVDAGGRQVEGVQRLVDDHGVRAVLPGPHHGGREGARTGPHRDSYDVAHPEHLVTAGPTAGSPDPSMRVVTPWAPMTYDALLLLSFGGPEQGPDVMPFLANVIRGRACPATGWLGVAEHYRHFGGRLADQRPEPRTARRASASSCRARHRPADLLGQPELASRSSRTRCGDDPRRRPPGPGPGDLGVLVVLRLPAVPGGPGPGGRAAGADAPELRQAPALLRPPGLHRAAGGRGSRRRRRDRASAAARPPGWCSRRTRSRRRWPRQAGPAARWELLRSGAVLVELREPQAGRRGRGTGGRLGPGLAEPQRAAVGAVARARRQRPPGGLAADRRDRRRRGAGGFRQRPRRSVVGPRR